MIRRIVILVPLVVLGACSSSSGSEPVPGAAPTTAAAAVPEPTTPPASVAATTPEAPSTEPPATTPVATDAADPPVEPVGMPTEGVTVVHAGSDSGGAWTPLAIWNGTAWSSTYDETGDLPVPAPSFSTVSAVSLGLPAPITGLAYGGEDFFCVDERTGPILDIGSAVGALAVDSGYNVAAAAADWPLQPRPVEQIGLDAEVYQTVGEGIVSAAGVDPVGGDVVQVVRADLDGNGVEEVLVTFEKVTEGFGTAGDFSVVYVRYPSADGSVVDEVIFEYYPEGTDFPSLGSASLLAVADFNGDAVMELVTTSRFWESHIVEFYEFRDGRLASVADSGCSL